MEQMKRISITIEGITPLICNKFTDAAQLEATNGSHLSAMNRDKGSPKEQAEAKLYIGTNGKPMIPQPNIFRSIMDGGIFFKNGKSKVTTQKTSLIPACLAIEELEIPIVSKDGWLVDMRPIRNPTTGGRRLCYRPMFLDWSLSFTMQLDTELLGVKMLREIVDAAGKRIGLDDFRPACKGPYGKYVVNSWK
jgi:hypothetical protein